MTDEAADLRRLLKEANERIAALEGGGVHPSWPLSVLEAMLLFHSSSWEPVKMERWQQLLRPILGAPPEEVTTKVLCDAARIVLGAAKASANG